MANTQSYNRSTLQKLEDNPIWNEANELAEYMYNKLHEFPEEEKWQTENKLRSAASDLIFFTAQAAGSISPSVAEYDWASALKHANALKTMYRFAWRRKFIELEPSIMVRLDALIKEMSEQLAEAIKRTALHDEEDLRPWLKKYEIWKKING